MTQQQPPNASPPYPEYAHHRVGAAPIPRAPRVAPHPATPRYPAGTSNAEVPSAAPVSREMQPVLDAHAAQLAAIGLDAVEIERYPDAPSLFDRFEALQQTTELIAGLIQSALPKPPMIEAIYIGIEGAGIQLNRHGRRYVGIRSNAGMTTPKLDMITLSGKMTVTITATFQYFILPDRISIFADASGSAGMYELVYLDDIGGAAPQ